MTGTTGKTLPLHDLHAAAGARFGDFAGWSMPLSYPPGVMKEHLHTREHAGLFDISHMKLISVSGPESAALLSRTCPLDAAAIEIGQSKYTFFLDDSAGIIDDLIITRLSDSRYMVVANAGNAELDIAHLTDAARSFDAVIEPLDRVFVALQGPEAEAVATEAGIEVPGSFMTGIEPRANWFVTRSGYTGEDGFEIGLPPAEAKPLVERLLADARVMWVGLAARDSLRLEAGLCLHGNDITTGTTPAAAGLLWAIPKSVRETGSFFGADAMRAAIAAGPAQKRVGLKPLGRQPVRGGAQLVDADGKHVGVVTSGGFGPSVGSPVAMGYVDASLTRPGTEILADVRGAKVPMQVHALPFTPHRYRKG